MMPIQTGLDVHGGVRAPVKEETKGSHGWLFLFYK